MKKGIIYKYTCSVTGKVYIGQTVDEKGRKHGHMSSCWKYNSHFYSAVRKYGWKNFTYEIIFETKSKDRKKLNLLLDIMEKFYIKKYDSFKNAWQYSWFIWWVGATASISHYCFLIDCGISTK